MIAVMNHLQACRAYCEIVSSLLFGTRLHVLVPFTVLELVEDSREVKVLLKVLDGFLALDIGCGSRLISVDVVPSY